jgi:hypothetical protein
MTKVSNANGATTEKDVDINTVLYAGVQLKGRSDTWLHMAIGNKFKFPVPYPIPYPYTIYPFKNSNMV